MGGALVVDTGEAASVRSARLPPAAGVENAERKRASRRRGRLAGACLAAPPTADAGRGSTGGTSLACPKLGDDGGDEAAVTVEPTEGDRDVRVETVGLPPRPPPSWKPGGGAGRSPGAAAAAAPASRKAGRADGRPDPPRSLVRENRDAVGAPVRGAAGARQPGGAPDRATGERTL